MKAKRILLMVVMTFFLLSVDTGDVKAADIMHSGRSGALDWSIDNEGCLTVNGNGDYEWAEWTEYHSDIVSAKINVTGITSTENMFEDCENLKSVDFSNSDTSHVDIMFGMFCGCTGLTSLDLRGLDTRHAVSMQDMFRDCSNLEKLDLSSFDTSNVGNMNGMFAGCSNLRELNLRSFNTSKTEAVAEMFLDCSSLEELDLSNFDLSDVLDYLALGMLDGCSSLRKLYTPTGLEHEIELPVNSKGKWIDEKGNVYTSLPTNQSESILLTVEGSSVKGDISDDGEVNITDLMMCLYQVSGRSALTGNGLTAADIDGNGKVELTDLMRILYFVSGRNSTL